MDISNQCVLKAFLVTTTALTLASGYVAHAEEAEGDSLAGEIVVTATRQAEKLSKVAVSVAAITQSQMDAQGVRDINDISRLTPSLALLPVPGPDIAGNRRSISIRGISSTVGSATTGIYLDDTPIQVRSLGNATSNAYPLVFDLERVEVLRGPQGTLFGAGAEGGAVRFITPRISLEEMSVYGRSELAFTQKGDPSYEAGASVGVPLVDGELGIRASAWYRQDGGWVDRVNVDTLTVADDNSNSQGTYVLRLAGTWKASDNLTATLAVFHQVQDIDDTSILFENLSDLDSGVFRSERPLQQPIKDKFTLPSLTLEWSLGSTEIISTTSFFRRDSRILADYTNFTGAVVQGDPYFFEPGEYTLARLNDSQRDFTQEIRVQSASESDLQWVFGVFYSRSKQDTFQQNEDIYLNIARERVGLPPIPLLNGIGVFQTEAEAVDKQLAGFGQLDYRIFEGIKLTAGIRVADTRLKLARDSRGPIVGPEPLIFSVKQSETPVTPKFGVSWEPDENNLFYGTVSKGYRIGGVNGPQLNLCAESMEQLGISGTPETYDSDSVWSYELGAKNRLGPVRLNASVFRIDWKNIQREIRLPACGSGFVTNLGSARSEGFDLEINIRASNALSVGGSVGYANARLTEDVIGLADDPNDTPPVFGAKGDKLGVPAWNLTAFIQYDFAIGQNGEGYFRGDYQYTGKGPRPSQEVTGADPEIPGSEAFHQVSLRLGWTKDRWDWSVFVNNLLNEAPLLSRSHDTLTSPLYFNLTTRPRTFGLTAVYRY